MNEAKYFLYKLIYDYLDFLETIKGLSKNTTSSYQRDLNKLSKFLEISGINSFNELTEEICSAWIADLFQHNVGARSIQRHISSAKGFFNYLKKSGLITNSPFDLINSPKSPSHLPSILSPEEVSQLLNFKPKNVQEKRDIAIIELIYSSGLRVSEAVNANLDDFEDNKNFLRVLGKGSKTRLVPVGRYARKAIDEWIGERKKLSTKDNSLFVNLRGKEYLLEAYRKKLGT